MSRQPGGNGGEIARGAGAAAAKGALLIGLAVIIGIVLLQQVDSDGDTAPAATPSTKPKTTTTKAAPDVTTTTVPAAPLKNPDELALIVLNGGAKQGDAGRMSTGLQQAGYTNQPEANNWEGHKQAGNSVLCKPGREREAVALSQQDALQGSSVQPFPDPAPPFSDDRDCVVVVGSA